MKNSDDIRRKQLGDFLKIRRARLSPEQAGIPSGIRRRTPGLRREEVSQLVGVSVDWYTWLEQGRDIHASSQVLESLAAVFHLNSSERKHLFLLAKKELPFDIPKDQGMANPTLQKFLDLQGSNPAYVTNLKWDIVAWNQAACVVFGDYEHMSVRERNTVWRAFTSPYIKQLLDDWDGHAQKRLAQFRASYSRYNDDPWWTAMIDDLTQISEEFRKWWSRHEVLNSPEGTKLLHHPTAGKLFLGHLSFQICDAPNLIATIHIPSEENTVEKIRKLLG
jgi:transcriptional regulator with XRE-family HTH domain